MAKPKFFRIVMFGNPCYINTEFVESVIFIDGKTRIFMIGAEGYFEADAPLEEIMQAIEEVTDGKNT